MNSNGAECVVCMLVRVHCHNRFYCQNEFVLGSTLCTTDSMTYEIETGDAYQDF